jgi:hypothetical protein
MRTTNSVAVLKRIFDAAKAENWKKCRSLRPKYLQALRQELGLNSRDRIVETKLTALQAVDLHTCYYLTGRGLS